MFNRLYKNFNIGKIVLSALFLAVYIAGVALAGGNPLQIAVFAVACWLMIILPGKAIYRVLGMENYFSSSRFYSLYFVFGMGFVIITFIGARIAGDTAMKVIPFMLALVGLACAKYKNVDLKKHKLKENSQFSYILLLYAFIVFIYTFLCVAKHAHPQQAGQLLISQDFMWTVGNAESFKLAFPPVDIRFDGVILKYHYFTELLAAALSTCTGISCYDIMGFYMQPFMLAFFIAAVYDFGMVYYNGNKGKTNIFMASFYLFSCLSLWKVLPNGASVFSYSLLETVISNVNSQCTALAFLSVFCAMVVNFTRGNIKADIKYLIVALLVFIALMFSKSPISAIVALAMICAATVNLLTKNEKKITTVFSVLIIAIFAYVYTGFLSGGTDQSTGFSLTKTLELGYFKNYLNLFLHTNMTAYKVAIPAFMVIQTVCMAPFQTLTVVPRMIRDAFRLFKLSFEKLWFYAAIAGGVLAFYISYHEAFSQVYFIYVAIYFLNLLAVEYFDFSAFKFKYILHYGLMTLSIITTLFFYTNFGGSGIRQYLFHHNLMEKYPYKICIKAEDELAGEYLRENMQRGELFVTNRTHTGQGEGLSNVYTCFSGRQSYMEGFKYTVSNMGVEWDVVRERLDNVGKVFGIYDQTVATADDIKTMCSQLNIRYALFSSQFEGETTALENFETVFEDGTVKVYKIY